MKQELFGIKRYFIGELDEKELPVDPIIRDAFIKIWDKLKSEVFTWDSFKTDLPFEISTSSSSDDLAKDSYDRHRRDLRAMCFDENGKRKRLDKAQLKQIAKTGRFTVKSQINENFDNVWLLGAMLQQGSDEITARFKQRRENALRHWFLYLPEYFLTSGQFTIVGGLKSVKHAFSHIFRILVGSAEYRPRYSDSRLESLIEKARINYLLKELIPDAEKTSHWSIPQQKQLNIILANPGVIKQVREIIQQLTEQLSNKGENSDEALLLALAEHRSIDEIDAELPGLIRGFHDFYLKLSTLNPAYEKYYQAEVDRLNQDFIDKYRFRGRYQSWREKQLLLKKPEIHQRVRKQMAADLLSGLDVDPQAYFLQQNTDFDEFHAGEIRSRLSLKMRVSKIFKLPVIQWSFRSLRSNEKLPVVKIKLATESCCWRPAYFATFTRMLIHNTCLKILRAWLFSPYGIKSIATLSKDKFRGELWLLDTGEPYMSKKYGTYLTDIDDIRQRIKKFRRQYEEKSDYGLFPRSIGRIFNLFFSYVIIGILGLLINLSFRILAFSLLSLMATFGVFLAPFWVPAFSLLMFLYNLLIYDYIGPKAYYYGRKQKPYSPVMPLISTLFYFMLVRGFLVTAISLLGVIIHLLAVPVIYLFATISYILRHLWDAIMRLLFIYPFARIPGDDFAGVVSRIAGHGIATNALTVLSKADALQNYKSWLQLFMLDLYESVAMKQLKAGESILSELMTEPYRAIIGEQLYKIEEVLQNNINEYESVISRSTDPFRHDVYSQQEDFRANLVRLKKDELADFTSESEVLCRLSIEKELFPWLSEAELSLFWFNLGITQNDWSLLNRVLLAQAFSADILTPIEACDGDISVEVEHINIAKSLLTEKQPMSKINFNVGQQALYPETDKKLSFLDNDFWDSLYEPFYLPVQWENEWAYILRLRLRKLEA